MVDFPPKYPEPHSQSTCDCKASLFIIVQTLISVLPLLLLCHIQYVSLKNVNQAWSTEIILIMTMSAMVQVMAWRPTGDKPLSEPLLTWPHSAEFFGLQSFIRIGLDIAQHTKADAEGIHEACQTALAGTTILVPCHVVKFSFEELIWRSGTHKFQHGCQRDFTYFICIVCKV